MIFKIQVNNSRDRVLIYDRKRSKTTELEGDVAKQLIENNHWEAMSKHYYSGILTKGGQLTLHKKVGDRPW